LIELAQQLLADGQSAFVIDLPAWTSSAAGILEHVAGMPSFQAQRIDAQGREPHSERSDGSALP
jgi:hypothetical protein